MIRTINRNDRVPVENISMGRGWSLCEKKQIRKCCHTDVENKRMDTKGGKWRGVGGGGMNWEIGIDTYTLICIKWITNKNLLYKR